MVKKLCEKLIKSDNVMVNNDSVRINYSFKFILEIWIKTYVQAEKEEVQRI